MAGPDDRLPDVVLTEAGVLTPEELALRQAVGTDAPVVGEDVLLSEEAARLREETSSSPILTGLERGISAATFGLTDVLASAETREERRRRVQADPTAAMIGEIGGAVIPGLLSGGTGAIGTVARLTPAGRLAAATGRVASRGGIRNVAKAGAIEGMAGAAGDYVSRTALDENAEFSAEALASSALKGAALGGVLGGVADLGARGLGRVGRKLAPDAPVGRLADDLPIPAAGLADDVPGFIPRASISGKKAPKKWTRYKNVVRKELADDSAESLRALGSRVDDLAARGARREVDELTTSARFLNEGDEAAQILATKTQQLADDLDRATAATQASWKRYADDVGLAGAKKRVTREAADDIEDDLIANIARTDELAVRFDRNADELSARLGMQREAVAPVDSNLSKLGQQLDDESTKLGLGGRVRAAGGRAGEVATSTLGAAELASSVGGVDLGIPKASDIPGVGPILGMYLKYKGARAAAKGLGFIPSTKASNAAGRVQTTTAKIKDRVKLLAGGALKRVSVTSAVRLAPAQIASRVADIGAMDPATVATGVHQELEGTTSAVQAAAVATTTRAVNYLKETAPQDPIANRPGWMNRWQPSQQEANDFSRRLASVEEPEAAIETALMSPMSSLELEALAAVYPELLQRTRNDLMDQAEELRKNLPFDRLRSIGRDFKIPLTIESAVPGYGLKTPQPSPLTPEPLFSRPSTPGASPSVALENPEPRRS